MKKIEQALLKFFGEKYESYMLNPLTVKNIDLEDTLYEEVTDIGVLSIFSELTYLNISGTGIGNITPLKKLKKLQILYADFCKITDIEPLAELYELRELDLSAPLDSITTIEPLRDLKNLEKLYIPDHQIQTLKPILNLNKLQILSVSRTDIPIDEIKEFKLLHPNCEVWY
ncbi:leucine-rich repeat domain-containing protein [Aneurinibacillus uraniidurans]|uniref:leucine-rich repeat domain-containing protein n=1 Tax=Aneurinibacillus uraniidurans TaxID=2966586 RepID=UPI00234A2F55|nr:leucine-rich repeat domain-containing protein [Aneurinibacillus sp. B1]WCN39388.1 hypothetical protein PO771_08355 [Aneurinibacillus sp. B1]